MLAFSVGHFLFLSFCLLGWLDIKYLVLSLSVYID